MVLSSREWIRMKTRPLKSIKSTSLFVFLLSILFFVFFDKSKHIPALAKVNPFAVDPYDAVGSFGIQVALFVAFISLIRVFRPYRTNKKTANQEVLIIRGEMVVVLSVIVTLAADIISMLCHLSIWVASPYGRMLATMVGGMSAITAITGAMILHAANTRLGHGSWMAAVIICSLAVLILVIYPAAWDEGVLGGISTAIIGMVLFYAAVWVLLMGFPLEIDPQFEDFMDDLAAIYFWIKDHANFANGIFLKVENFMDKSWCQSIFKSLNPRKHAWKFIMVIAFVAGVALALVQAFGEGISSEPGRAFIVIWVFISLESMGILLGYGLFARFLGIYRTTKSV
jgi:hypothetical protein